MDTVNVEKKKEKKRNKNWVLIPSIFILGFLPLLMHKFTYKTWLTDFDWFAGFQDTSQDLFLAWKAIAVIITGILMIGILLYRRYRYHETMKMGEDFYPFIIYEIFVLLSAIFSNYKRWVFCGSFGMLESVWVVLAYMILCYYTYHCIQKEGQVYSVLKWAGIGTAILITIGFFQYLGFDFFQSKIGRILVSNLKDWEKIQSGVPKHVVCAPFYNQNNACVFYAMIIPVILVLIICCKKKIHRIILIVAEIAAVMCMIGSISSAGVLALLVAMAITIFVLMSRTKKTGIIACCTGTVGIVAVVLVCVLTPIGSKASTALLGTPSSQSLRSIDTTNGYVEMNINHQELFLTYKYDEESDEFQFACVDEYGNTLPTRELEDDSSTSIITNILYLGCRITPTWLNNVPCIKVTVEDHEWFFTKDDEGEYYMFNQAGKWESYKSPEFLHVFNDNAVSGRGHIWNGSLKSIMDNRFILGNGANTFVFAYPQNDYIYRAYNDIPNQLDVKAHNIYLQQWIENGVFALCGFILLFLTYILKCVRLYRKSDLHQSITWVGIGVFTGVVSYLISGLANDSNLSTAPVFWVLLGVGMAVNRIIEQKFAVPEPVDTENPVETTDTKEETDAC